MEEEFYIIIYGAAIAAIGVAGIGLGADVQVMKNHVQKDFVPYVNEQIQEVEESLQEVIESNFDVKISGIDFLTEDGKDKMVISANADKKYTFILNNEASQVQRSFVSAGGNAVFSTKDKGELIESDFTVKGKKEIAEKKEKIDTALDAITKQISKDNLEM